MNLWLRQWTELIPDLLIPNSEKMKRFLLIILLATSCQILKAQSSTDPEHGFFFALIVEEMETSIEWYQDVLEFEIQNQREISEMGLKQANLKRGSIKLELIELASAIDPDEFLTDENKGKRRIGIFKVGFTIPDFDKTIDHIKESSAKLNGDVVTDPISGKKMAILLDPDGNRIQLFE